MSEEQYNPKATNNNDERCYDINNNKERGKKRERYKRRKHEVEGVSTCLWGDLRERV